MDIIITDLDTIDRLCDERWDENLEFREFIKWRLDWSDRKLDALVKEIAADVAGKIDCTACANCCKTMGMAVSDAEIKRLSRRLEISTQEFEERYVTIEMGDKMVQQKPCPFLEDCKCSLYDIRPKDCKDFPHLHKSDFRSRTIGVVENYGTCPIVFNTVERLKAHLGFRLRRSRRRR